MHSLSCCIVTHRSDLKYHLIPQSVGFPDAVVYIIVIVAKLLICKTISSKHTPRTHQNELFHLNPSNHTAPAATRSLFNVLLFE